MGTTLSRHRGAGPTLARLISIRVLERVERVRAFADLSLHSALAHSDLSGLDRALATEIVYGTLRWRGRIDFMLGHVLDRPMHSLEPMVASTLRAGAYQILFSDRIPASAAVDESVRCARALGAERATGLVNAVLRRLARDHVGIPVPALSDDPLGHLVHALSMPEWIAKRWLERLEPSEAAALARASNQPPPRTLRANRQRTTRDELLASLRARFSDAQPCEFAPEGIALVGGGDPGRDPGFLEGLYTVQDEASQLVVDMLDPQPGEQVLDTCAAPGTKSTSIAERVGPQGEVLALDRNARRLRLVARDARRLALPWITTHEHDATESLAGLIEDREGRLFDRVLVDAPCSGLGSLRRNPDARWRLRESDIASLVRVQEELLARASEAVKIGGTLVYSTCTILSEENEPLVARFLAEHEGFRQVPADEMPEKLRPVLGDDGSLQCRPHLHGTDGFYAARLVRTA